MDFEKQLKNLKQSVDQEIEAYLDRVINEIKSIDPFMFDALKYFKKIILTDGKRIRPIMIYWGYKAAGGINDKEIIKTSISIELIHSFLLMHDDIIDRDDLRHGVKTIHARYRDHHKNLLPNYDAEHFGNSIAIVMGDFIYSLGNQVIFESNFDSKLVVRALNKMQDIVGRTCVGEIQDVYMEYSGNVTEEQILKMYENKTARYTFEGPMQLGAMLAGASDEFCETIAEYAVPLGVAFQIRDDMLGIYGDTKKTGKPVGSDITEGKMTLLAHRALQSVKGDQKKKIKEIFGNNNINNKDVEVFRDVVKDVGAYDSVEADMKKLMNEAREGIKQATLDNDADQFLLGLVDYLNKREK